MTDQHDLPLKRHYDPEPLLAFLERRAREHPERDSRFGPLRGTRGWLIARFGERSNMVRQLDRWRAGATLTWWYADKVAGMLGVHPAWIWPDWYDLAVEDLEVAA